MVLEKSFATYIRLHPTLYQRCLTQDCGQLYRPRPPQQSSTLQRCLRCLHAICLNCNACHDGMSCGRYLYTANRAAEATKATMEELGVKECPRCKTPIEKTEGCNHMTFIVCNAHICWICSNVYKNQQLTYDHFARDRGGIFDAELGQQDDIDDNVEEAARPNGRDDFAAALVGLLGNFGRQMAEAMVIW